MYTYKLKVPHNRPEDPEEGRVVALLFLDLGTRRRWVVSTTPLPLYPQERPSTHCTGGWVGPRASWTCVKNLTHTGIRSLDQPAHSQFLY
jgi:hypothetical protein